MSDFTSKLVPLAEDPNDNRPLPERIAAQYDFPLAQKDHVDGKRYYAVQDWIAGVAQTPQARSLWAKLKKRAEKMAAALEEAGEGQLLRWWEQLVRLPYRASNGKEYMMDYADAETLYRITQRMDVTTKLRNEILAYLAKSGVVIDEMYRDPDKADEIAKLMREKKEYRKLRAEGFTHEEALQWLETRDHRIGTRKWVVAIWFNRNAHGKDVAKLTNRVSEIVHGKTATKLKEEMGIAKYKTPRDYDSSADQALTALTELMSGLLHERRDSLGVDELMEDVNDTKPIVDGARPGVFSAFSKKPRRLPGESKPQLTQ